MNKIRRIAIVVVILMVAAAGVIIGALALGGRGLEVRQSDGTVLRLEKVSFEQAGAFVPSSRWQRIKQNIAAHLPNGLANKLVKPVSQSRAFVQPSFSQNHFPPRATEPRLNVWITRINTSSGKYQNVNAHGAELIDADGCAICCTTITGEDPGLLGPQPAPVAPRNQLGIALPIAATAKPASVVRFSFDVFPRRESELKLRVFGAQREVLAEYKFRNPVQPPPLPDAPAPSLPISATNRGVVFKLTGIISHTNPPPRNPATAQVFQPPKPPELTFSFECTEAGAVSGDWQPLAMELRDSAGNYAPLANGSPYALCTKDPAWRLQVKFAGRDDVSKRVSLKDFAIPGKDTAVGLSTNIDVDGALIQILGAGGPGRTAFSNYVAVSPPAAVRRSLNNQFNMSSSSRGGIMNLDIISTNPYVLLKVGDFPEDERITVCAIDEQGRRYFGSERGAVFASAPLNGSRGRGEIGDVRYLRPIGRTSGGRSGPAAYDLGALIFDLPLDVKVVDLEFRLHRLRTVTFNFKPPDH